MQKPEILVNRFYREVWDHADEDVAREILCPELRFRGSLGPKKCGVEGFIDYLRAVHAAFGKFESIIEDLLIDDQRAAAQMRFGGIHRAEAFGFAATYKKVEWSAAAFFEISEEQIISLWVLGDVDHVKSQLGGNSDTAFG